MNTTPRPLNELAEIIFKEGRGKSWFNIAKHYVEPMLGMTDAKQDYYYDSGTSVVMYALSNLQQWRGEVARQVKIELKQHCHLAGATYVK
jgi:hypothetical protein